MPDQQKRDFISTGAFEKMALLQSNTKPAWGVMNAQEMTEHLADFFNVSTKKIPTKLYTPQEHLPKYMEFLLSEKQFKENTKAPAELLGEIPLPLRYSSLDEARENLRASVNDFNLFFSEDPAKKTLHPAFGMLNYDEWVLLHYKHVLHHLKQFGLMEGVN